MADTPPILDYAKSQRKVLTWANAKPVVILTLILIPLELGCAQLAFHTIGEVVSSGYYVLLFLNLIPLLVFFASRRLTIIGLLLIAMLIVPYQLFLGVRWWRVHREADRIVAYLRTGAPAKTYVFRDAGTRPFINLGTRVDYWIGTPTTSHWYDPAQGWLYYPD